MYNHKKTEERTDFYIKSFEAKSKTKKYVKLKAKLKTMSLIILFQMTRLPDGAGQEYAALAGDGGRVFVVGGRSGDGESLRSVYCYDLATDQWSRLCDMTQVRWYHGAVVIGTRLFAVLGKSKPPFSSSQINTNKLKQ